MRRDPRSQARDPLTWVPGHVTVLLIDGPDGVGKTTYAKWMADQVGAVYLHRGRPQHDTWWEEHLEPVLDHMSQGRAVVMDRGPVGNPIWSELFNDEDQALFRTRQDFEDCLRVFAVLGGYVQIMMRDPRAITQTLMERGENRAQIEVAQASVPMYQMAYNDIRNKGLIPCTMLDSDLVHQTISEKREERVR